MKTDEITDLIALRDNQLKRHTGRATPARGRPSAKQRLSPYRGQLMRLITSSPSPTVRELVELLSAAGVKIHRETLSRYLRREFNWKPNYGRSLPQGDMQHPHQGKETTTESDGNNGVTKQTKPAILETNVANLVDTFSKNLQNRGTQK